MPLTIKKYKLELITYKNITLDSSRVEERVHTAGVIHTFSQITITTNNIQNKLANIEN